MRRLSFDHSRHDFRWRMYQQISLAPRRKHKRWADHHAKMAETWIEYAHRCGRPAYHEAPGFTYDRWGKEGAASIAGCEKPYGFRRAFWGYVWKAMKSAFLSAYVDQESTYSYDDSRRHAILTGITS